MGRRGILVIALSVFVSAACTSAFSRSDERWRGYRELGSPYQPWADCIRTRSAHYFSGGADVRDSDARIFSQILAECREHMSGPAWDYLSPREARRLIGDAYHAFFAVGAEIHAEQEAGII